MFLMKFKDLTFDNTLGVKRPISVRPAHGQTVAFHVVAWFTRQSMCCTTCCGCVIETAMWDNQFAAVLNNVKKGILFVYLNFTSCSAFLEIINFQTAHNFYATILVLKCLPLTVHWDSNAHVSSVPHTARPVPLMS